MRLFYTTLPGTVIKTDHKHQSRPCGLPISNSKFSLESLVEHHEVIQKQICPDVNVI